MARQKLEGLQALRGVAAVLVLVHHALEEVGGHGWGTRLGACGVDIFFVISGFVMVYSSEGVSARSFVVRRLARVAPLYWLCTLAIVAAAATGAAYRHLDVSLSKVLASLAFVAGEPVLYVGWTLEYEMAFYLLFAAVIAVGLFRAAGWLVPLLLVAAVAVHAPRLGDPIVLEFAFGVMLGALFRRGLKVGCPRIIAALAVVLFAIASAASPSALTEGLPSSVRWLWWGGPSLMLVYAALAWKPRSTLVGDASYSLYLTHGFVMVALARLLLTTELPRWLGFGAAVLLSLSLGLAVYWTVERPMQAWFSARLRSRRPVAERAASTA